MKNLKDVRVRYTHPAIPPVGVEVGKVYTFEYLSNCCKLDSSAIKTMFIPIDMTWDNLENKNIKKNRIEETVIEDSKIADDRAE